MLRKTLRFLFWWVCLLWGLAALSLVAFWGGYLVLKLLTNVPEVYVPDVQGMHKADAILRLSQSGFLVKFSETTHDEYEQGTVIGQWPRPSTLAKQGRTICLTVSKGASRLTIPEVVNLDEFDARVTLSEENLEIGFPAYIHTADIPAGRIVVQDPPPGNHLHFGRGIGVLFSAGLTPESYVMPPLINEEHYAARRQLQAWGFRVAEAVFEETDDSENEGLVLDTEPRPGERVTTDDEVILIVGSRGERREPGYWDRLEVTFPAPFLLTRTFDLAILDDWSNIGLDDAKVERIVTVRVPPGSESIDAWLVLAGEAAVEVREPLPGVSSEFTVVTTRHFSPPPEMPSIGTEEQ